jgi:hypothetical protein
MLRFSSVDVPQLPLRNECDGQVGAAENGHSPYGFCRILLAVRGLRLTYLQPLRSVWCVV